MDVTSRCIDNLAFIAESGSSLWIINTVSEIESRGKWDGRIVLDR